MKRMTLYIVLLMMLLAGCSESKQEPQRETPIDTVPLMVMQIQKCSKLYTAEYQLHKIVTHDDQMRLKGSLLAKDFNISLPFGDRKIAIPMDATVKAYIDFEGFSEKNIHRKGKQIEIILPDPKVELTSSKINHQEIKRQVSIFRGDFTDAEMTNYEKQGRIAILNDIPKLGIIDMAQESAANILIPMLKQMGYEENDIKVTFRKKFTANDLNSIIDKKSFAR